MTIRHSKWIIASALGLAVTNAFAGQVTLYERPDLQGRAQVVNEGIPVVQGQGFGNVASSIVVDDGIWQVCAGANFNGRCVELPPGSYPGIDATLNGRIASVRQIGYTDRTRPYANGPRTYPQNYPNQVAVAPQPYPSPMASSPRTYPYAAPAVVNPPLVAGRAVLYELPNFGGASAVFDRGEANDLDWAHFSNPLHRAVSIRVESGQFLFCTDMAFRGDCLILGPGEYPGLPGPLITGISSARQVGPEYSAYRP